MLRVLVKYVILASYKNPSMRLLGEWDVRVMSLIAVWNERSLRVNIIGKDMNPLYHPTMG